MSEPEPIQEVIARVLIQPQYGGLTAAQAIYFEQVAPRLARELTAALAEVENLKRDLDTWLIVAAAIADRDEFAREMGWR